MKKSTVVVLPISPLTLAYPFCKAKPGKDSGKNEAHIYGRLKLVDLIPPVAAAFLKDEITIGHALLIAKLQASQQQEVFAAAAFRGMITSLVCLQFSRVHRYLARDGKAFR